MGEMSAAETRAGDIVAGALKMEAGVAIDDTLATLPAWDSLAHLSIVLEIEAVLGRPLTGDEIVGIDSVRAVASLLEKP